MKRGLSDSENDEDVFEDDESEHRPGSPTQSCHAPDRKRRRGIIEKRRRDRINYSLAELKRLVPAAFEKQGSSKLEKAEILKMTVDHLKMMQSRGGGGTYGIDTASVAMDFRSVGFRECAAEVARYLVAIEGLDSHDPLCVRLLSHLHYYPSTASNPSSSSTPSSSTPIPNWHSNTTNRQSYPKPVTSLEVPYAKPVTSMVSAYAAPHNRQVEPVGSAVASGMTSFVDYARFDDRTSGYGQFRFPNAASGSAQHGGALVDGAAQQVTSPMFAGLNSQFLNIDSSSFGYNNNNTNVNNNNNPSSSLSSSSSSSLSSTSSLLQCLRPYRPWGVDLVY